MKPFTNAVLGIAVAAGLTLAAVGSARAQGRPPATRGRPTLMSHPTNTPKPSTPAHAAPEANNSQARRDAAAAQTTMESQKPPTP